MQSNLKLRQAALLLFVFFLSCKTYKQVQQQPADFFANKKVIEAISGYDIFLHGKAKSFELKEPYVNENGIGGELFAITDSARLSEIKSESPAAIAKHKYRVNMFTTLDLDIKDQSEASAAKAGPASVRRSVFIKAADIDRLNVSALDKKATFTKTAGIIGVAVAIVAVVVLVVIFAQASNNASNASSNSSNSSAGSGNSNSGGSNSGGSNSGGSNSGGSCYIATMVYGDYDAPEVMVLRKFRDNKLAPTLAGRMFIACYYRCSPWFVQQFRHNVRINNFIRNILDRWVDYLQN